MPDRLVTFDCDDFDGIEPLIAHYLESQGLEAPPACAIGFALPVVGDRVTMTNRGWAFSIRAVRKRFGFERFVALNDFAMLSLGVPTLRPAERVAVGGGKVSAGGNRALVGPGTGLGVAGLVESGGHAVAVAGEGGHASLAACDEVEERLLAHLRKRFKHVSAERVLSGQGLVNVYGSVCALAGESPRRLTPQQITKRALDGSDARCEETVEHFFALLGSVAGNVALTFGALGGVYIGGGIVPQLGDWIGRSRFRERFEAKGRYRAYLAAVPTFVIHDASALALRGANRALEST